MLEILRFIHQTETVDDWGDPVTAETAREVIAEQISVGQSEFYQAHAAGLKPEIKFRLADYLDYEGEALLEHNGQRYRVLRTYRKGQELELTCYQEVNPA